MTLAQLIDDRASVFQRPTTVRDIIRNRKIISISKFEDIVLAAEQRKNDEALLISPEVDLIPKDKLGMPQYYSSQNYSKRGPLVKLPTLNINESIEKRWTPLKARIEANEKYKNTKHRYVGWYWTDPENYAHIIQPWMVMEGRRLEMYGQLTNNIQDKVEYKKFLHAFDRPGIISVSMKVPSRSQNEKEPVTLEHMTRITSPQRFAEWTRFSTRHACSFKQADFGFKFSKYITYCPHDVAAHVGFSRHVANKSGIIIPQIFPMFTEPMLRLYLTLVYDTMHNEVINDKGHLRKKHLSYPKINPILMDAWLHKGNKKTFFIYDRVKQYQHAPPKEQRKTMRDYNWENSAPGLPF